MLEFLGTIVLLVIINFLISLALGDGEVEFSITINGRKIIDYVKGKSTDKKDK